MTRAGIVTREAPTPAAPYSQGVNIGGLVAIAGQVPLVPGTRELVSDDPGEQTRQVLQNLRAILNAGGLSMDDVLQVRVFLADGADFSAMNAVYAEVFSPPYPARTTVYVGLAAGMKVEIDALAVAPSDVT